MIPDKLNKLLKEYNIIENLLLLFSVISVNFFSYIAYYDISILSIIDSTAITKFTLTIIAIYILISASTTVILFLFQNIFLVIRKLPLFMPGFLVGWHGLSKEYRKNIHDLFDARFLKHFTSVVIFIIIYVGERNFLLIISLFLILLLIILILKKSFQKETEVEENTEQAIEVNDEKESRKIDSTRKADDIMSKIIDIKDYLRSIFLESIIDLYEGRMHGFFTKKIGVFIIFISIILGLGRANFVENNMSTQLNKKDNMVLFLTTSNGALFYNIKDDKIIFSSWDNISSLVFNNDSRRSISNFFISEKMHENKGF